MAAQNDVRIAVPEDKLQHKPVQASIEEDSGYSQRGGRWLRAAVLGATDGFVSVASLMTGVKAVTQDVKAVILTGFAGLVAGASGTEIGEVVSEREVEVNQMKRDAGNKKLLNPIQAAAASALHLCWEPSCPNLLLLL